MSILYLLIPLSLILLGLAVWAFFWAVKNDQFDDLEGPAHRILFDEDENDFTPEERERRRERRNTTDVDSPSERDDR
ncbi:cbb3-type cytochrome oxidase assembly protein CcoS [Halomonas faecis]|uniref:cbb3-type cytochrome oxidase assembly protein CcoS n=1 Tax=Halomonas faecis TaxID=1562110 RepID=UPI0013D0574E|nr:cbb3-type cytochrome oxidase assembly protein CcoS [Halomonas faecis]